MKRKRFALLIGIASAVIPMMPVGYYCFFAFVRNEHFYRGFPTSYWERAIKRWKTQVPIQVAGFPYIAAALNLLTLQDEPAVLEADDDAGPVLVDLFRSETAEVRRAAVLHLADTRLHGEETAFGEIAQEAYALNLPASYCNQVMLVLVNWRQLDFDPYTDDLVLIDGRGRLLDHLSCSIENPDWRFGVGTQDGIIVVSVRTAQIEMLRNSDDGTAEFAVRATTWPETRADKWTYHITHDGRTQVLKWNPNDATTRSANESTYNVLCRFAVRDGRFEVLWPPLKDGKEVSP